jgi:hypothetical protein
VVRCRLISTANPRLHQRRDAKVSKAVHAYDAEVAERTLVLAVKVDEFALLLAGEPDDKVSSVLDAVHESLRDTFSWAATELFVEAVRRRKREIERNVVMPVQCH